jgi:hypothetical protein
VRKYVEQGMKLHRHYGIKEKLQDINKALNTSRDGDDAAVCWILKSIQKLDQKNTTTCLEAENVLPSPRMTLLKEYKTNSIKIMSIKTGNQNM